MPDADKGCGRLIGPYPCCTVITGDARELGHAIPPETVDLVFTDPPYSLPYLPLYGWLSTEAQRVLTPGAYLFAYGGAEHLPARLQQLSTALDYFWLFALLHHGAYPRMWHKKLMSGYKPVLVFTKGQPNTKRWMSTVHTSTKDKRFHRWGQGTAFPLKIIDMLTNPDDLVWDPFTGGGQIPTACQLLERHYLAFEIDPDEAHNARNRLRSMNT